MKTASLGGEISYQETRPTLQVLLDTASCKEIRIAFKKNQEMKRHQTPFPIVVEVFEGVIDFGLDDKKRLTLNKGDLIALDGGVPHDLIAKEDSIVRLSLNKADSAKRVKKVAQKSKKKAVTNV